MGSDDDGTSPEHEIILIRHFGLPLWTTCNFPNSDSLFFNSIFGTFKIIL